MRIQKAKTMIQQGKAANYMLDSTGTKLNLQIMDKLMVLLQAAQAISQVPLEAICGAMKQCDKHK